MGALTAAGTIFALALGVTSWFAGGVAWPALLVWFLVSSVAIDRGCRSEPGARSAAQVLSNGFAAFAAAVAHILWPQAGTAAAFAAAVAAACSDTWATSVGTRFGKGHFRLTRLTRARAGASGVVSVVGLLAAMLGAAITAGLGLLLGISHQFTFVAVAGFAGCVLDSILGDTLQQEDTHKGPLTNNSVNLLSTLGAAIAGYVLGSR